MKKKTIVILSVVGGLVLIYGYAFSVFQDPTRARYFEGFLGGLKWPVYALTTAIYGWFIYHEIMGPRSPFESVREKWKRYYDAKKIQEDQDNKDQERSE